MANKIDLALKLAAQAFEGRLDKDGNPAVLKAVSVGMMGKTDEEKTLGFLHNIMETGITYEYLLGSGLPSSIVEAVRLLTMEDGISHSDYISRIVESHNPVALQVKYNEVQFTGEKDCEQIASALEERSCVELYAPSEEYEVGIFACGCFWGVQHLFDRQAGVKRTLVGYTGGKEQFPCYADVRDHKTSHVEAVAVEYDPAQISYTDLCKLFYEMHDPAQTDGVGPDIGPQYRSCIFYRNHQQKTDAENVTELLRSLGYEVNTLMLPESDFWIAEENHQYYYDHTRGSPYCHVRERKFPR